MKPLDMDITVSARHPEVKIIKLKGRIDETSERELKNFLFWKSEKGSYCKVVIDLGGVSWVSENGWRMFFQEALRCQTSEGIFILVSLNADMKERYNKNLSDRFPIADNPEAAADMAVEKVPSAHRGGLWPWERK